MTTPARSTGPQRRRRIDVALIALVGLLAGIVTSVVAAVSGGERVAQMWVGAVVAEDGSSRITEVIDYDFGRHDRHGIDVFAPGLRTSAPIEVSSPDAPDDVDLSTAGTPRIRIGDPDRTVNGLHRYVVSYTLDGLVRGNQLSWDAVGTMSDIPMENVEVHVTSATALETARCTVGAAGSTSLCGVRQEEPGHLVARVDALEAHEGVTVSATAGAALAGTPPLPAPPATAPPRPGLNPLLPGGLAALLALLSGGVASRVVRRAGRERVPTTGTPITGVPGELARIDFDELSRYVVPTPTLPAGLSPAEGGALLTGRVLAQHKAAWLIEQAVAGIVELEPEPGNGKKMMMIRLQPGDLTVGPLLDLAFRGRDRLPLGSYDRDFATMWEALGRDLTAWQRISNLWDAAADRRALWMRAAGGVVGLVGLGMAVLGGYLAARQADAVPLVLAGLGGLLAGVGAAALIRGWELRVLTPAGSAAWLQVESLRQFLASSPPTAVDQAIATEHIGRYTAWAVALGEAERWSQLTSKVSLAAGSPYDRRGLYYAGYAPVFVTSCSSTSVSPSSSSGGGGSVGSGAGGGGVGSW